MAKQIKTKKNTEETVDAKTVNLMRLLGRTRQDAAEYYAKLIMGKFVKDEEWVGINNIVKGKWSESGLKYIKRRAWKTVDEHERNYNCDLVSP
jgi:hypothetical protein